MKATSVILGFSVFCGWLFFAVVAAAGWFGLVDGHPSFRNPITWVLLLMSTSATLYGVAMVVDLLRGKNWP